MERRVPLLRDADSQFLLIPAEFELPYDEAIMRKEGDLLIIEPLPKKLSASESEDASR